MKKVIGFLLVGVFIAGFLGGCAMSQKRAGYVSKYPCHARHPCEH